MKAPTKAELQDENDRLREQLTSLRIEHETLKGQVKAEFLATIPKARVTELEDALADALTQLSLLTLRLVVPDTFDRISKALSK